MHEQDRALNLAERVLRAADGADQAQVVVAIGDASYARFGGTSVTQNLDAQQTTVTLTYYRGKRAGRVTTADTGPGSAERIVAQAKAIADRIPPDNGFVSLPKPHPYGPSAKRYFAATAESRTRSTSTRSIRSRWRSARR